MSKEAGFLETIVKDSKGVGSNTLNASKKDEPKTMPSLFDTMLNDVSSGTNVEQEKVIGGEKTVLAQDTVKSSNNTVVSTPKTESSPQIQTNKELITEVKPDKSAEASLSLLDRLLNEVSEQINNDDVFVTPKMEMISTSEKTETFLDESIKSDSGNKSSSLEQIVLDELNTSKGNSVVSMDSLGDATQSSEVLSEKIISATQDVKNVDLVNDVIKTNSSTETQNTPINTSTAPIVEGNAVQTNLSLNETTSVSLLDKLVNDATVQIQKETTPLTVVTEAVENTDSVKTEQKIIDVKQTDLVKSIQNMNETIVKETKILTSVEIVQNVDSSLPETKATTTLAQTKVETVAPLLSNANDKVIDDLSKVTEMLNEKTSLTKEQIENVKSQVKDPAVNEKEASKSLLDKLIEETNVAIKTQDDKASTKGQVEASSVKMPTDPILTNIYLSSVNKTSKDAFLEMNQEVKTLVTNATSIKDVQKGADLLNLGLENSEVVIEEAEFKQNVKNDFLNKLSINRDIIKHDIMKMSDEIIVQDNLLKKEATLTTMTDVLASKNLPEVEVNVSSSNAYNIENRIIGARQQMGSMMSDLARNMYINYKPPVTAFRMNLNPGNLGSIAVLIKNDKENGLSISLNMSNVATLDSIVDNQGALRAALAKNFNTNANINLEFNMQDGKQQGNNGNQQNKRQQQNHRATNDILESLSNKNESNKVTNYM